eukprot:COSAG01_NODE_318_length_18932_cov_26.063983_3_plen_295_part_00
MAVTPLTTIAKPQPCSLLDVDPPLQLYVLACREGAGVPTSRDARHRRGSLRRAVFRWESCKNWGADRGWRSFAEPDRCALEGMWLAWQAMRVAAAAKKVSEPSIELALAGGGGRGSDSGGTGSEESVPSWFALDAVPLRPLVDPAVSATGARQRYGARLHGSAGHQAGRVVCLRRMIAALDWVPRRRIERGTRVRSLDPRFEGRSGACWCAEGGVTSLSPPAGLAGVQLAGPHVLFVVLVIKELTEEPPLRQACVSWHPVSGRLGESTRMAGHGRWGSGCVCAGMRTAARRAAR